MYYIYIGRIRKSFFLVLHPNTVFLWKLNIGLCRSGGSFALCIYLVHFVYNTIHPNTVFLWNILAYSERSYTRYMLVRRRNRSRKATTVANTELDG